MQAFVAMVVVVTVFARVHTAPTKTKIIKEENLPPAKAAIPDVNDGVQPEGAVLLEGDIASAPGSRKAMQGGRWTNGHVNYRIGADMSMDGTTDTYDEARKMIYDSIAAFERLTCLTFTEIFTENDPSHHLYFTGSLSGCWSYMGMLDDRTSQTVSLSWHGCMFMSTVIHEIGHAVGLHHEQSRPDRDEHLDILWQNIKNDTDPLTGLHTDKWDTYRDQFGKEEDDDTFGILYDYLSVMHYGKNSFAARDENDNKRMTMRTADPFYADIIGTGKGMSFGDTAILNVMYNCEGKNVSGCIPPTCLNMGYVDMNCECVCMPGYNGTLCENSWDYSPVACGGRITTETTLETPNYPDKHPSGFECTWMIEAPNGQRAQVEVNSAKWWYTWQPSPPDGYLYTSISNPCISYIDVFNGNLWDNIDLETPYKCHDTIGQPANGTFITAENSDLRIKYIDNNKNDNPYGLQMRVTFVDGPTVSSGSDVPNATTPSAELANECEWSCFGTSCTLFSPGYGRGGFGANSDCWETMQNMCPHNLNCQYVVDVSSNNIPSSMCEHIQFDIVVDRKIERINLCEQLGAVLVPTGNLNVNFYSNGWSGPDLGFAVNIYQSHPQPDCYGHEEIGNGVRNYRWSAPRAGKRYLGNIMCEKVVQNVNRKKKQCIRFKGKVRTKSTSCVDGGYGTGDYLLISVYDDPLYLDVYPICGSHTFDVTSYGNTMRALWVTDGTRKPIGARVRGFKGLFSRVECPYRK